MSNFFWLQPVVRNTFYPSHKCFLTVSFMETLLFAVHAGVPVSLKNSAGHSSVEYIDFMI